MGAQHLFALAVLAGLLQPSPACAEALEGPVAARVERVIDGDTVEVRARIWIDQELTVAVRIAGVDAPELFRPTCAAEKAKALEAKAFATEFFEGGEARLRDVRHDKYGGRVVARLENSAGDDLGEALVAAGLAARGLSGAWCDVGESGLRSD